MHLQRVEKIANELRAKAVEQDVEDGILCMQNDITIQEVQLLRESFSFCDADGSGFIDREELSTILRNLGFGRIRDRGFGHRGLGNPRTSYF